MKKILVLVLSLLLILPDFGFTQKKVISVACVGNSITYGSGIVPRNKNSYPAQLQAMLGSSYKVMNFGVSGRTLLRKGNHPYWIEKAYHEALASDPDIVTIMLGTNDSKAVNRPFYSDFEKDYSDLIDSFRALPSHPRVIMLLPLAAFVKDTNSIYDQVIVQRIIPMECHVAYNKKVEMIDFHPMFINRSDLYHDRVVHPNPLGDQKIAQRLYEQIMLKPVISSVLNKIKIPKTISNYHGYQCADFKFAGRNCKVVAPYTAAAGHPWIWRARFFGNQPQTEIALLERGFTVAYMDASELYGNKQCIELWNKFYAYLHTRLGLNKKAVLEGFSRGGAYIYDWAAVNPDKVACVYADAPVLDFKSWPGGKGGSIGSARDWAIFKKDYNLSESQALAFRGNPLDKVSAIVQGHYPMLHVVGDADTLVPVKENTALFEKAVKTAGGEIQVIHKSGGYHHPHSLANPAPIVNFILRATGHFVNQATIAAPGAEYRSLSAGWVAATSWYDQADNIQHTLDSLGKVDVLMLGNSITLGIGSRSLIRGGAGKAAFDQQFNGYVYANGGISGDRVQNLLWRVEKYNYNVCTPKVVVITIGVNNFLDDATPDEIAAGIKKLVALTQKRLPQAKILLTGPLPAGDATGSVLRQKYIGVHKSIAALADNKHVFVYKYNKEMLLQNGQLNPDFYTGDIHLKPAGYGQWAKYLFKQLKETKLL
jgi:lysophospholipase L1-like esterase/pimeloyl-ACP methyl ester carboxylesterase